MTYANIETSFVITAAFVKAGSGLTKQVHHGETTTLQLEAGEKLWTTWTGMRHDLSLSQHLSKRLRAKDRRILTDGILYRDHEYFRKLEEAKEAVEMTAALEEKGDSGPLVPCQVTHKQIPDVCLGFLNHQQGTHWDVFTTLCRLPEDSGIMQAMTNTTSKY